MIIITITLQTMGRAGYNYDYNYTHTADQGDGWVYKLNSHCRPWGGLGIIIIILNTADHREGWV